MRLYEDEIRSVEGPDALRAAPKEPPLRNNQLRRRSEDLRVCPWRIHRSEQIGVQEVVERLVDRESPRAVGHFGAGLVLRKRLIATRTAAGIPIRRFDQMAISPTGQAVLHGDGQSATSVKIPKTTSRVL